ncbi:MBL fold metallo-hydrolase [Eilatimonas milleporae]|uniref:Glyoxylase-like metal-dependent hydrolase (Beta-lactamase superfamily II) n=1 Tax=Eilatimonas milleporae TaxID=911205 RepID=A0A3M0CI19_9PROT|nr:MBL fold metallo-hydrolase [Eilatimonas milleporae]RMB08397.1 glyoxylase-like metal-dependent hydrolase (beta-lactamase superfamily II) [Eilatimonas milleporae]
MPEEAIPDETVAGDDAVSSAEAPRIADHRDSVRAASAGEKLTYPVDAVPDGVSVLQLADGLIWARIPLPWSLDHINVYLFDEGDSWTLIDTGAKGERGRQVWFDLEDRVLDGKPIGRVIATHLHPDHLGLAGWLCERHGAEFWMTQTEYLLAQTLWLGAAQQIPQAELDFMWAAGVDRQVESMVRSVGYGSYKKGVSALPGQYVRMEEGTLLKLGGRLWQVVIGRGHCPEHACLVCLDEPLFISGDQVLPRITSNVSVYAREPRANPLGHWIASLDRLKAIPGDPLVLPSHGKVFKGLHRRLDDLIRGHVDKLAALHEHCRQERTAVETFPALYRRKITGFDFFMALGEAVAHCHLLEALGLLDRRQDGDVYRFKAKGRFDAEAVAPGTLALPGVALAPFHLHDAAA